MADLQRSNRALEEARSPGRRRQPVQDPFLAAASHDLLQPLNAARLFLSALAETELPESAERLIENVDLAFELIDRLLTALLDISKLDAGRGDTGDRERAAGPAAAAAGGRIRARGRAQGAGAAAGADQLPW